MLIEGNVWRYGDNVDTDAIVPARYLSVSSGDELAHHCLEDLDPGFAEAVSSGDVIVAGKNFGCGSSREHAPLALQAAGVSCIVAASFARIFYRNAINIGLPILTSPEAVEGTSAGDRLTVDLRAGTIVNERTQGVYRTETFPPFVMKIIEAGGLVPYTAQKLGRKQQWDDLE